jgi:hypothetical protein
VISTRRKRAEARVPMRLLLLGLTGAEPAFVAWRRWLEQAAVAFDPIACKDLEGPLSVVRDAGTRSARPDYQAIILTDPGLLEVALESPQRTALTRLEAELDLRRLIAYAYPGPEHGLELPGRSGPLDEIEAGVTAAGRAVFGELRGPLPIDPGSWVYRARPDPRADFQPLICDAEGSALIGVHRLRDGRHEMVQTFNSNAVQAHGQAVRRGQLAWLTHGAYLGYERHYLPIQVDDVLLGNHSWSVGEHQSDRAPTSRVRMTADDARRAGRWARERRIRLDLVCNGGGSLGYVHEAGEPDPLLRALREQNGAFGWINHTFRHADIDVLDQPAIEAEIAENVAWAREAGISLEASALVTGAHTGLANLAARPPREENVHLRAALRAQRVRYVACDASRPYRDEHGDLLDPGTPFLLGSAVAVPRHPTVLPHDAVTPSQVLDRLRAESEAGSPVTSFDQVVLAESRRLFAAVLGNDPRPHYFHQSNMIGSDDEAPGLIYTLLDAVLRRHREHFVDAVELEQPTLGEIGRLLLRVQAWRALQRRGAVRAWRVPGAVEIENRTSSTIEVPLTGTERGEPDATSRSGWVAVAPGTTRLALV